MNVVLVLYIKKFKFYLYGYKLYIIKWNEKYLLNIINIAFLF